MGLKLSSHMVRAMHSPTFDVYLAEIAIEKNDDPRHATFTSMTGGKYAPPDVTEFYTRLADHLNAGGQTNIQENTLDHRHGRSYRKAVLDIDGYTKPQLKEVKKRWLVEARRLDASGQANLTFYKHKNDRKNDKCHLYLMVDGKTCGVHGGLFEQFIKSCGDIVDNPNGLRLPGCMKKEGREAGVYSLPEYTAEALMKHSPNYWCEVDEKLTNMELVTKYVEENNKRIQEKAERRAQREKLPTASREQNHQLIEWLLPHYLAAGLLDQYDTWDPIGKACNTARLPASTLDSYCRDALNYVEGCVDELYDYCERNPTSNPIGMGTLIYLAREYLPKATVEEFEAFRKGLLYSSWDAWMWEGHTGLAQVWVEMVVVDVVCVDPKGASFVWNEESRLWEYMTKGFMDAQVTNDLSGYLKKKWRKMKKSDAEDDEKKAMKRLWKSCQSVRNGESVFKMARKKLWKKATADAFRDRLDSNPDLLPVRGGMVVDLRTGEARARTKEDYFSTELTVGVGGNAEDEDVVRFFSSLMSDEPERVEYLQRYSGYLLTGHTKEKLLSLMHGPYNNGKSEYQRLMSKVLGAFAKALHRSIFVKSHGAGSSADACTPYLVGMEMSRLGLSSETGEGMKLNEETLKMLTGGDTITINPKGKASYTVRPPIKLLLATNHIAEVVWSDPAMRARVRYIEFKETFVLHPIEGQRLRDDALIERLNGKLDDVFAWLLQGARRYYQVGMWEPECMKAAMEAMVQEEDLFLQFKAGSCGDGEYAIFADLHFAYCDFIGRDVTKVSFSKELKRRGYEVKQKRVGTRRPKVVMGITLEANDDEVEQW